MTKDRIAIIGVGKTIEEKQESLIKLEPIFAWLGYVDDTDWNNRVLNSELHKTDHIVLSRLDKSKLMGYHNHLGYSEKNFKADEVNQIINHILK